MTLIVSCLTPGYVLQVADRRLVLPTGKNTWRIVDDDRCKIIVLDHSFVFAYTGVAEIDGKDTAWWFAEIFKPFVDADRFGAGIDEVARRATESFRPGRYRSDQRSHTFIGVGWLRRPLDGTHGPIAVRITNAFDDQGRALMRARDHFVTQHNLLRRGRARVLTAGYAMASARVAILQRLVGRVSALTASRLVAKEIRRISDNTVGKHLLVACIPKAASTAPFSPIAGRLAGQSVSTMYIPDSGNAQSLRTAIMVKRRFPLIVELDFNIPPTADGSDPYAGWRD